jgi:hypothetical protein
VRVGPSSTFPELTCCTLPIAWHHFDGAWHPHEPGVPPGAEIDRRERVKLELTIQLDPWQLKTLTDALVSTKEAAIRRRIRREDRKA